MDRRSALFIGIMGATASALFVACVGDSPDKPTPDAAAVDQSNPGQDAGVDSSNEASVDAGRCNVSAPFGAVEAVAELNSPQDDTAAILTTDELTAYFSSNRDGGGTMTTTRSTPTALFPAAVLSTDLAAVTPSANSIWLSPNELTALVTTGSTWQVQLSTRVTKQDKFTTFTGLSNVNGPINYSATMRTDGKEVFIGSPRDNGKNRIYVTTGNGTNFGNPVLWNLDNTAFSDGSPVLSLDGLTMYFSSNRTPNDGGSDPWMAKRANVSSPFGTPVRLAELASNKSDDPTWISADECIIYFNRGSVGTREIVRAKRGF